MLLMMKLDSTFSGAEQAEGADSYLMAAAAEGCMAVDRLSEALHLLTAAEKLRQLRQYAETMPLPELLHTIVDVLQLEPLLTAQEFGLEKLANIKK